ncbi:hypothetical protein HRbin36_01824 [bacterium HR36]|nr:hypothetical protein HRbin36_01824 [bacterium HR36]
MEQALGQFPQYETQSCKHPAKVAHHGPPKSDRINHRRQKEPHGQDLETPSEVKIHTKQVTHWVHQNVVEPRQENVGTTERQNQKQADASADPGAEKQRTQSLEPAQIDLAPPIDAV